MAGPRAWNTNVSFNFDKFPFFKDSRVRKAFSLAIDREEIIKKSALRRRRADRLCPEQLLGLGRPGH